MKFILATLGLATLLVSCSLDDDMSGGGGPGGGEEGEPGTLIANLFVTSNTKNTIISYDFTTTGIFDRPMKVSSNNNEGLFYDDDSDEMVVVSGAHGVLNTYINVSETPKDGILDLSFSSDATLEEPRDLVVYGDFYIVSDTAELDGDPSTDEGRFFIFKRESNGFTLRNTVSVNYAVWGIELIGNDLYTVMDKSSDVAVLKDFLTTYTTDVTAIPDKSIEIGGLTRIHGITEDNGTVVLTDIGDTENDADGGFHIVEDFTNKFDALQDGDILQLLIGNQIRVSGSTTQMGNPVAVAYDDDKNTIFIAENTNGGGKVLFFDQIRGNGGNIQPTLVSVFEGASSLYFNEK